MRKHLERNRKDKDSKFRLILIESRIHRLSRYYKSVGVLPPTWKLCVSPPGCPSDFAVLTVDSESSTASALVA